ncbi:flagellar basal body L-ring protein FlgH [Thalassomonas haliotis]|uniref:Flagellar L-ring protein n=1 Tax=Thalassomonas haliotis TaxID=485448 RepID=A0ABY7VFL0_9GAMM|nr:flagellar basal body L-ring protein FlgH [Thalassomonas haliotis]WDE11800.1 flagellar basal body L-ring protein FlgH [Thalassomonas haliotis]
MKNRIFILALLNSLLFACSTTGELDKEVISDSPTNPKVSQRPANKQSDEVMPDAPAYRPIRGSQIEVVQLPTGSLFNPRRAIGLYQPSSHYQVGDMILIRLEEKTTAKKSLDYKTDKNGHFELQPVTFNAGNIQVGDNDLSAEFEQENTFDSSAQTKQNNSLTGDITVSVRELLPNGNLIVSGEKWLTLNTGDEYIRFSGQIRASDIDSDNSISSVKVGNARIEYSGKGEQQSNQEKSLLGKLFGILE